MTVEASLMFEGMVATGDDSSIAIRVYFYCGAFMCVGVSLEEGREVVGVGRKCK